MILRNRIRIVCAMVLGLVSVSLANHAAEARDRRSLQSLGYTQGDEIPLNDTQRRALAYSADEYPPWLKRVLAKLQTRRGPNAKLTQMVLFRRDGKPTYLVLRWMNNKGYLWKETVEIHRVKAVSPWKVVLYGLWQHTDREVKIVEPTGHDVYGNGLPTVFVEVGSGGTGYFGYGLLVIRPGHVFRDLAPVEYGVRPIIAADLLEDGRHVLVASDDRWGNYFHGCGQCGPLVPTVFIWSAGEYRPACRDFQNYFQERIAVFEPGFATPVGGGLSRGVTRERRV